MTAVSVPAGARVAIGRLPRWVWAALLAVAAVVAYAAFGGAAAQPHDGNQPFFIALNELRDWIRDNRDNALFQALFVTPREAIDWLIASVTGTLHGIGWPGLVLAAGTIGLVSAGVRMAMLAMVGFAAVGFLGLWTSTVDTLGAIIAAVAIAFGIGVPLGVLTALNATFRRIVTPILDVMQIMPTFAYLAPFVMLFGIGPAAAAIVTLIYAMPAAIRITALGIRRVPSSTVEVATSLGATGRQTLGKVRLPLARRELGLALNQTIMLALSMIVITALIDAPGLGQDTIGGLIRNDVGRMFDAGVAIVILAIILDRLTEGITFRIDPRHRAATAARAPRRALVIGALAICAVAVAIGLANEALQVFPDTVRISFRGPINAFVDWLRTDVAWFTGGLKDQIARYVLNPFETVLTTSPWWVVVGVVAGITVLVSGIRPAVVASASLVLILLMGLWEHSMQTLMQVLVATAVTVAVGLTVGILAARNDRFAMLIRPVLDAAQTMPAFVYLIPAFVLFDAGRFTAIMAAVVFALPPVIRLVDVGIRSVPAAVVEAGASAGATSWQLLTKVQLPMARPALLLATNQAVILVLSMVVVGGLTGGQALGYDVVAGFSQGTKFGLGLAAGICLVLLGITLDRMTQGAGGRSQLQPGT